MARLLRFGFRQARAFFHGMGSVLCLFPAQAPLVRNQASDKTAIAGDFACVGNDIRVSMNRVASEHPEAPCVADASAEPRIAGG